MTAKEKKKKEEKENSKQAPPNVWMRHHPLTKGKCTKPKRRCLQKVKHGTVKGGKKWNQQMENSKWKKEERNKWNKK